MRFFGKDRATNGQKLAAISVWNGWTESLIAAVDGVERFDIVLDHLNVTTSFDGADYADAVSLADYLHKEMALLSEEKPSREPHRGYVARTVEAEGHDARFGLHCMIEIYSATAGTVVERAASGTAILSACDPTNDRREGSEWGTPCLIVKLYDVDGELLTAIRHAFQAAAPSGHPPSLRLRLTSKMAVSKEVLANSHALGTVASVVVWETWPFP